MSTEQVPRRNIPSLDGLRAISILLVMLSHAAGTHGFPAWIPGFLTNHGRLGVQIFFVISGFLITTLLLDEKRATGRISLRLFYTRRSLRIFPPFYFFLAVSGVAVWCGILRIPSTDFLLAATYTMNYSQSNVWALYHTWSLSIEEQFYLVWPLIFKFCSKRTAVRTAAVLGVTAPPFCLAVYLFRRQYFGVVLTAFPFSADAIAFGCLLAVMLDRPVIGLRLDRFLSARAGWIVPVAILLVDCLRGRPRTQEAVGELFLNVSICYCIARYTRFPDLPGARVLNVRLLSSLGKLSYSLYLWQQPFLQFGPAAFERFPLNVVAAFACGVLSYNLIELPMAGLRRRFRPHSQLQKQPDPAALSAAAAY